MELFKKLGSWLKMSHVDGSKCELSLCHLVSLLCNECRASLLMPLKSLGQEVKGMKGGLSNGSRRSLDLTTFRLQRPWSHSTMCQDRMMKHGDGTCSSEDHEQSFWATMPAELLRYIIQKVDECRSTWPLQIDVIACASVCRAWRDATKDIVRSPEISGKLTFPVSVMQPGPRDGLLQCFIRRDRISSTYHLYLSLTATLAESGKFLLAARKLRRATGSDYVISLDAVDMTQGGKNYVGKLRSNFLGTKFTIHENLSLECGPTSRPSKCMGPKLITHQSLLRTLDVAHISYELNILGNKGPRRMYCTLYSVPASSIEEGGSAPGKGHTSPSISLLKSLSTQPAVEEGGGVPAKDNVAPSISRLRSRSTQSVDAVSGMEVIKGASCKHAPLVLKNKSPRWHEQLQCWCLNFKGRVTVASVKNFQLVAATEPSQGDSQAAEQDKVLLQFGKIGKDTFTMDYKYPLSAVQAFAICLSSFDTKLASE